MPCPPTHPTRHPASRFAGLVALAGLLALAASPALAAIPFPRIDPVAFSIGPFAVHWYGLAYVVAIVAGWRYARRLAADERLWGGPPPLAPVDLDDLLTWVAIGVIAGGRLGYVLFYQPSLLLDPLSVLAVWNGGMSFHGGMLGTILAMVLFARARGLPAWSTLDTVAAAVPIGLFFGRLANFINAELWGAPTALPWGVVFPGAGDVPRHPSQLYEALLEGIVLFLVLRWLTHARRGLVRPGLVGGAFVAGYGLMRMLVEFVRVPDAHVGYLTGGWLTLGMLYSLPMVLAGAWAMHSSSRRPAPPPRPAEA